MPTNLLKVAALVAVAMLAPVGPLAAEYETHAEMQRRLAELESLVADLQLNSARYASHGREIGDDAGGCSTCGSCCGCDCTWVGQDFYNCRKRCCGMIAGAELLFLKGFFTDGGNPNTEALGGSVPYETDFDYQNSPRLWIGWLDGNGTGGRFTFWEIDKAANTEIFSTGPTASTILQGGLEMRTYDIEMLQQTMFRAWVFETSGGVRVAEHNYEATQIDATSGVPTSLWRRDFQFTGTGLTAAMRAERVVGRARRLSVYSGLRGSLLYGQGRFTQMDIINAVVTLASDAHRDDLISIWQMAAGAKYVLPIRGGGYWFISGGVEAQIWEQVGNLADLEDGDVGLAGFSGSVGIWR